MGGNVLVVEDDHAVGWLMCEALTEGGISVECVASDREAYARITDPPILSGLVVDVNLGQGTTGYDVARFARQVIPTIGVIYVSGEVPPNSFQAFGVPGSAFIEKPFSPAELVDAVRSKLCACAG